MQHYMLKSQRSCADWLLNCCSNNSNNTQDGDAISYSFLTDTSYYFQGYLKFVKRRKLYRIHTKQQVLVSIILNVFCFMVHHMKL